MKNKTQYTLAILLLFLANAIPIIYYYWAKHIAQISWQSWAGTSLFIIFIGPIACFFSIATFAYWWEISSRQNISHIFPVICMIIAIIPIILYTYIWLTN